MGNENAKQQAQAQLESIVAMIAALRTAGNDEEREVAQTRIEEDPLSVEVRGEWHAPGGDGAKPSEFMILLCTGGPAVRIIGELNQFGEPDEARIEYQDWFTPWQTLFDASGEESAKSLSALNRSPQFVRSDLLAFVAQLLRFPVRHFAEPRGRPSQVLSKISEAACWLSRLHHFIRAYGQSHAALIGDRTNLLPISENILSCATHGLRKPSRDKIESSTSNRQGLTGKYGQ